MQELRLLKVLTVSIHVYCRSYVGGQKLPTSPSSIKHNRTSSYSIGLYNCFSLLQMTSDSVQRHVAWFYRRHGKLVQIDHNLCDHAFDDVI